MCSSVDESAIMSLCCKLGTTLTTKLFLLSPQIRSYATTITKRTRTPKKVIHATTFVLCTTLPSLNSNALRYSYACKHCRIFRRFFSFA